MVSDAEIYQEWNEAIRRARREQEDSFIHKYEPPTARQIGLHLIDIIVGKWWVEQLRKKHLTGRTKKAHESASIK